MALYLPDVSEKKFLPRLERVLTQAGLGKRIRDEIRTANAVLGPEPVRTSPSPAATTNASP